MAFPGGADRLRALPHGAGDRTLARQDVAGTALLLRRYAPVSYKIEFFFFLNGHKFKALNYITKFIMFSQN